MFWKNWPSWLKGGLIGAFVFALISILRPISEIIVIYQRDYLNPGILYLKILKEVIYWLGINAFIGFFLSLIIIDIYLNFKKKKLFLIPIILYIISLFFSILKLFNSYLKIPGKYYLVDNYNLISIFICWDASCRNIGIIHAIFISSFFWSILAYILIKIIYLIIDNIIVYKKQPVQTK